MNTRSSSHETPWKQEFFLLFPWGARPFLGGFILRQHFSNPPRQHAQKTTLACAAKPGKSYPGKEFHISHQTGKLENFIIGSNLCLFGGWDMWSFQSRYVYSLLNVYYTLIPFTHAFFLSGLPWLSGLVGLQNVWVDEQTQTYRICIHMSKNLWNHQDVTNNRSCHVFVGDS